MLAFVTSLLSVVPTLSPGPAPRPPAHPTHAVTTWSIDPTHSELRFRIRQFLSKVSGTFTDWDGTVTGDPANWSGGSVTVTIRTRSIDTGDERRDTHLRSEDFFDAERYPEMTFRSSSVRMEGENLTLTGDLTIKGTTKPITLTGMYRGIRPGPAGKDRVGFEFSTTINRLDYGVSWNRAAEGGGMMLGDEVAIEIAVEAVREP